MGGLKGQIKVLHSHPLLPIIRWVSCLNTFIAKYKKTQLAQYYSPQKHLNIIMAGLFHFLRFTLCIISFYLVFSIFCTSLQWCSGHKFDVISCKWILNFPLTFRMLIKYTLIKQTNSSHIFLIPSVHYKKDYQLCTCLCLFTSAFSGGPFLPRVSIKTCTFCKFVRLGKWNETKREKEGAQNESE